LTEPSILNSKSKITPSPLRRGRSISSPIRGGHRRGFHSFLPLSGEDTEGVSTGGNLTPTLS